MAAIPFVDCAALCMEYLAPVLRIQHYTRAGTCDCVCIFHLQAASRQAGTCTHMRLYAPMLLVYVHHCPDWYSCYVLLCTGTACCSMPVVFADVPDFSAGDIAW